MTAGCMEGLGTRRALLCLTVLVSVAYCMLLEEKKRMCVFLIAKPPSVSLQWHFIITQGIACTDVGQPTSGIYDRGDESKYNIHDNTQQYSIIHYSMDISACAIRTVTIFPRPSFRIAVM